MSPAPDNTTIEVVRLDDVALVELRKPPHNFLDLPLLEAIVTAVTEMGDAGCRAVVLAADGKNFCGGADLRGSSAAVDHPRSLDDLVLELAAQPVPVVAAIQGAAVGAGFGLIMLADFRLVSDNARISANFARLGFHHGWGLSATLPRVAGTQTALDLLVSGRPIAGAEAVALGVADRAVAPAALREAAFSFAGEVAAAAPLAARAIRTTLRRGLVDEIRDALRHETAEQRHLLKTRDAREGIRAAAEGRPPRFTGE